MHQGKRKECKKRNSTKNSRKTFDIETFTLEIDGDSSSDNELDDFSADKETMHTFFAKHIKLS